MNNEIKEVLDYISDRIIPNEKWNELKNYITNLNEELEKYKRYVDENFLYSYEELQDMVLKLQEDEIERLNKSLQELKGE